MTGHDGQGYGQGRLRPIAGLCLLVIMTLSLSTLAIARLERGASHHADTILALQDFQRTVERLDRAESRITSPGGLPPEQLDAIQTVGDANVATLAGLLPAQRTADLAAGYRAYLAGIRAENGLFRLGFHAAAADIQNATVATNGQNLRTEISEVLDTESRGEHRAREQSTFWLIASLVISSVVICGLILTYDRFRRRAGAAARLHATQFRSLIQQSSDMVIVTDLDGRITFATPAAERILAGGASLDGRTVDQYVPADDRAALTDLTMRALVSEGQPVRCELRVVRADGTERTVDMAAVDLVENPAVNGIVLTAHDVTERKVLLESLHHQAHHDSLTSLPNRLLLTQRLEAALAQARLHDSSLALLFLDMNGFKSINDHDGHETGDEVLIAAGVLLQSAIRPGDIVARLGGDEFVVLLDGANLDEAEAVAARIDLLLQNTRVRGVTYPVSASIGIAILTDPTVSSDQFLRLADADMYRRKRLLHLSRDAAPTTEAA